MSTSELKALTLHQPWATLAVLGIKGPETRSWQTQHRGRLAIHAAARTPDTMRLGYWWCEPTWGAEFGLLDEAGEPHRLPLGAIVGTVELVDCAPIGGPYDFRTGIFQGDEGDLPDRHVVVVHHDGTIMLDQPSGHGGPVELTDKAPFGDYSLGRYAWILSDPKPTTERCPLCWGTGWTCDSHGAGDCAACRSFDGSLSGCRVCTPPAGCGGPGVCDPIPARGYQGLWTWRP